MGVTRRAVGLVAEKNLLKLVLTNRHTAVQVVNNRSGDTFLQASRPHRQLQAERGGGWGRGGGARQCGEGGGSHFDLFIYDMRPGALAEWPPALTDRPQATTLEKAVRERLPPDASLSDRRAAKAVATVMAERAASLGLQQLTWERRDFRRAPGQYAKARYIPGAQAHSMINGELRAEQPLLVEAAAPTAMRVRIV